MKKLLLIIPFFVELITLKMWFTCLHFLDFMHYSSLNIVYQIDTYINAYSGMPRWFARLFHNKPIQVPIDVLRIYLQFWDIRFGSDWFSLIGYFGIFSGFYYIAANKNKKIQYWFIILLLLLLPFIEIFLNPRVSIYIKSIYLWLPYTLFSLYGIYQYIIHGNRKRRIIIIILLLLFSIWLLFLLPHTITNYCTLPPVILKK